MKQSKKLISLLLSLLMVLSMTVGMDVSSVAETEGVLTYEINDGEATITDCDTSASGELIIPDTLSGYPVTEIGVNAFKSCASLRSITIPDSVTSIDYGAFKDCDSLISITIPDSVTSIGDEVFHNTGFYNDESNWENGVLYIGNHCIKAKNSISESYTIKDGTICVADSAFSCCASLTSITIPDSVISICTLAFDQCTSLTSITIPDSVTSIGNYAFYACRSLTSITIPDSVTSIGDGAFEYCSSLASITIPDSVTRIGDGTLSSCDTLTSITIPDSVTDINDYAFYNCASLTSITIPDSVTSIGEYAIGYVYNDSTDEYEKIEGFIIYGTPGTAAETYANKNGITFVPVGEEPPVEEPTTPEVTTKEPATVEPTTTEPTTKAPVTEPTTAVPTSTEPATKEPTTEAPTTQSSTTTEPTTQAPAELIVKDADSIAVAEDEKIASIGAVDNKGLAVEVIKAKLGNEFVSIVSKDGEELAADALVGTGCTVRVLDKDGNVLSEYTVLVPMDVNGDAAITAQDARAALRAAAQLESLDEIYLRAAKTDADKALSAADARRILRKAAHLE